MSIITAIQAFEDAHAEAVANLAASHEGVKFFTTKVEQLEKTLAAIRGILPAEEIAPPAVPGVKTTKVRGDKSKAATAKGADIPATSFDFFLGCLAAEPRKTDEILAVAAEKLGITGDEKIAILRQRMTVFLQKGSKDEKFKSTGERQNRTYSL